MGCKSSDLDDQNVATKTIPDKVVVVDRERARGTRSARPVRKHAVNSRRDAPRLCT